MDMVNIHQAKTHLSHLLERVAAGEEIIIGKNSTPVAKLIPVRAGPRRPGRLKGKIHIAASFDEPLPDEVAAAFRGRLLLDSRVVEFEDGVHWCYPLSHPLTGVQRGRSISRI